MAGWCVGQGLAPAGVLAYPGSLHRDSTGHLLLCYPLGLQYPLGMLKVSSHCRWSLVPVTGSVSFRSAETPATLFKVCSKRTVWCGRRCRTDESDFFGGGGEGRTQNPHNLSDKEARIYSFSVSPNERQVWQVRTSSNTEAGHYSHHLSPNFTYRGTRLGG